jgi:hypothetical protein
MNWFNTLKSRFWKRYTDNLFELEKRRLKKEERRKKKQENLRVGTIGYGLSMHQKPWEVAQAVYQRRQNEREAKKKT